MNQTTLYRLIIALSYAEHEIRNPGACAAANVDVAKMVATVLKEADPQGISLGEVKKQLVASHTLRF